MVAGRAARVKGRRIWVSAARLIGKMVFFGLSEHVLSGTRFRRGTDRRPAAIRQPQPRARQRPAGIAQRLERLAEGSYVLLALRGQPPSFHLVPLFPKPRTNSSRRLMRSGTPDSCRMFPVPAGT
jgi:hypothetical protein